MLFRSQDKEKLLRANKEKTSKFVQSRAKDLFRVGDTSQLIGKAQMLVEDGMDPFLAAETVLQDAQTPDTLEESLQKPAFDTTEEGIFSKGGRASVRGRAAAIAKGIPFSEYEKSIALENPSFLEEMGFLAGKTTNNLPVLLAGGALGAKAGAGIGAAVTSPTGPGAGFGAAAGGIIGGGAGALSLETLLDGSLREYHQFLEGGGKGGFEEFLERAGTVGGEVAQSGITGAALGILSKAIPALKGIPSLAPLFERGGKPLAQAAGVAIETGGLAALETARKGKLPTLRETAGILATVGLFRAAGAATEKLSAFEKRIANKVRKTGAPVETTAAKIAEAIEEKGIDIEKVQAGDAKEQVKFDRVVRDVTKEVSAAQETTKDIFEQQRPSLKTKVAEAEAVPISLKEGKRQPPTVLRETVIPQTTLESVGKKRPETLVKEAARFQEITPKINELQTEIRNTAKEINRIRVALEKETNSETRAKLQDKESLALEGLKRQQKDVKALEKELKTGRKVKIVMKSVLIKGKLKRKRKIGKIVKKVMKYVRR